MDVLPVREDELASMSLAIDVYLSTAKVVDRSVPWEWGTGSPFPLSVRFTFIDVGPQDVALKSVLAVVSDPAAAQKALVVAVTQARNNVTKRAKRGATDGVPSSALKRSRDECCWGAVVRQGSLSMCDPTFRPPTFRGCHFTNKFCHLCRANGIVVPLARLRALSPEAAPYFENTHTASFWSGRCRHEISTRFRVINRTKGGRLSASCAPARLTRTPHLLALTPFASPSPPRPSPLARASPSSHPQLALISPHLAVRWHGRPPPPHP